jgi:hypothetical protein
MSSLGANVAQSVSALGQAQRTESAKKRAREDTKARARRPEHEDEVVVEVETLRAVRDLKGNDQEETHEDREATTQYRPDGSLPDKPHPHIDVQG